MNCDLREDSSSSLPTKKDNSTFLHNNHIRAKMVFSLREELKSPFNTSMEEFSDFRVNAMCKSTLKNMKGTMLYSTQSYQPHMYQPNNSETAWHSFMRLYRRSIGSLNMSNNSDNKKKTLAERVIGKSLTMQRSSPSTSDFLEKRNKEVSKPTAHRYKIEGLQTTSKFDLYDEIPVQGVSSGAQQHKNSDGKRGESSKAAYRGTGRRDSVRPTDLFPGGVNSNKKKSTSKEMPIFPITDMIETADSDTDLTLMANMQLSRRQQALKLLGEIQLKLDKKHNSEDHDHDARKTKAAITPQEALQCAWLRLSKTQIETLEELIRQQGKDPGIHAHSDVSNYDVFSEIREIRKKEKAIEEDEEYNRQ